MKLKYWYKNLLKNLFGVFGLVFIIVVLTHCRSSRVIEGREDYFLLEDIEDIEYKYSLNEGIKYRLLGDPAKSVYFLNRCLEIFPYSDVSYYELSKVYFGAGENNKAISYAENALDLDPDNIWYYHQLGILYKENENYKKGIDIYNRATSKFPDEIEFYYMLALLYTDDLQFADAINIYNELENIYGIKPDFSLQKEKIYTKKGEYENAHNELKKLVANFPDESSYLGILAEFYQSLNMYSEALESYQKLFKINPDNGLAQLSMTEFFLNQGEFQDAFFYLNLAINNSGLEFDAKLPIISSISQNAYLINNYPEEIEKFLMTFKNVYLKEDIPEILLSEFYLNSGQYSNSLNLLEKIYHNNPDNEEFAEQFISVLSYKQEYQKVIEVGEQIINTFSENLVIHYNLGLAYHINDNNKIAIEIFENCLNFDIENYKLKSNIYSFLGDLYYFFGEYEKSDKFFELAIDINEHNLIALNNYAYYLSLRNERLDLAMKYSSLTIEIEPENPSFLDTSAWILYKLGEYAEALKYIEMAYQNGGNHRYEIVKHYGQILVKLGRVEEAKKYFNHALTLVEDTSTIDSILDKL